MIIKPSRLALSGMALICAATFVACNDSGSRLQFVTVAPLSGEIYVSAAPAEVCGVRLGTQPQEGDRQPSLRPSPPLAAPCNTPPPRSLATVPRRM